MGDWVIREGNEEDHRRARARGFDGCDSVMEWRGEGGPSGSEVEEAWFIPRQLTDHERRVETYDLALRNGIRHMLPHPSFMRGYLLYSVEERRRLQEEVEVIE